MTALVELDPACPPATDGEIAAINLQSARRGALHKTPRSPAPPRRLSNQERLVAQFLGDLDALDRLDTVAAQFARVDGSSRAALVQAEVSSIVHRFDDARDHLARRSRTARLSMFAYDCADTPVHTLVCDSDR